MVKSNKSICNDVLTVQKDIMFICWKLKGKNFLLYIFDLIKNISVQQNINWIYAKSNRNIFKDSIILSYNCFYLC